MAHREMRSNHIDLLITGWFGDDLKGSDGTWWVDTDGRELDVELVDRGVPRVVVRSAVQLADPIEPAEVLQRSSRLPFGRLEVHDDTVVVRHALLADAVTDRGLRNAIDFVTWAAGQLEEECAGSEPVTSRSSAPTEADDSRSSRSSTSSTEHGTQVPAGVVGAAGYL